MTAGTGCAGFTAVTAMQSEIFNTCFSIYKKTLKANAVCFSVRKVYNKNCSSNEFIQKGAVL